MFRGGGTTNPDTTVRTHDHVVHRKENSVTIAANAIADTGSAEGLVDLGTLLFGLFGGSSNLLTSL